MRSTTQIDLDLSEVETSEALHDLLYKRLSLPDYYGSNWDAFWEVIGTDEALPDVLVLHGWTQLEEKLPRDAPLLRRAFEDRKEELYLRQCRVVYA